jgi:flagellar protein FliL
MSKKVLLIIIAVVVLMMSMMGVGFFILWHKMSLTMDQVQTAGGVQKPEERKVEEAKAVIMPVHKLETLIVNLADQGGKRYLRVTMELELSSADLAKEIQQRLPQVRDSILMILPTKEYAKISTTEGKIELRDEIIARLNSFLRSGTINTIYFTEFVVQ